MAHSTHHGIGRRDFARVAAGAFGAAALTRSRIEAQSTNVTPGIKLCVQGPAKPTDDD